MSEPDPRPQPAPVAERRPVMSDLHGVRRVDDYAWLRDASDPDVLAYLAAERRHYDEQTAHSRPLQDELFGEMSGRTIPADSSVSWSRGGLVYYTRTLDGKEYEQFCASDRDLPAGPRDERVILDLNVEATGHDYIELGVCEPSPDGRLLAWSADTDGNEVYTLWIRDLATGEDTLVSDRTYYTCAWSADGGSLFYTVPHATYRPDQVRRHDRADGSDALVVAEPDPRFELTVEASRSGALVLVEARSRTTSEWAWIPAHSPTAAPSVVWPRGPGVEYVVEHVAGDAILVLTNDGASEFRVVRGTLSGGVPAEPAELVPGDPEIRWDSVDVIGGHAVVGGRRGAMPFLRVVDLSTGEQRDIEADLAAGQIALARNEDPAATRVRVRTQSLTQPPQWHDVELDTGQRHLVKRTDVPAYDAEQYVTERVWATARDGEHVPVSLVRRFDVPLDGTAPCLLWGYGAYESTDWPEFDPAMVSLLDRGVVYAQAHIRGGGELGRRWWDAGHLAQKENTFRDFVDVADWLAAGLVDGSRIVSRGLSAGGLLQGAALDLKPERWAAVVAEVPYVDCVNSMLDPDLPLTAGEWEEWGDPRDAEQFHWLLAYSPYDNPPTGPRPALLVTGSLHDPRVLVHEPAKWVARLRATAPAEQVAPLLFRCELGAGAHVGPAGRFSHLRYEAEVQAFILGAVGLR